MITWKGVFVDKLKNLLFYSNTRKSYSLLKGKKHAFKQDAKVCSFHNVQKEYC